MTPIRNLATTFAQRLLERIALGRVFTTPPTPPPETETP